MTKQEQLRYEFFIETGILWIDTNDNIEMDYLKWVENKALTIPAVVGRSEQLPKRFSNEAYKKAKTLRYEEFVEWWDSQV